MGPFLALEFCIHVPMILCFSYFWLAHAEDDDIVVWSSGSVAWSCLILTHICLQAI